MMKKVEFTCRVHGEMSCKMVRDRHHAMTVMSRAAIIETMRCAFISVAPLGGTGSGDGIGSGEGAGAGDGIGIGSGDGAGIGLGIGLGIGDGLGASMGGSSPEGTSASGSGARVGTSIDGSGTLVTGANPGINMGVS